MPIAVRVDDISHTGQLESKIHIKMQDRFRLDVRNMVYKNPSAFLDDTEDRIIGHTAFTPLQADLLPIKTEIQAGIST